MTMMGKTCPVRTRAFSLSGDKRARRAAMSPLGTACFDIFSPPPGAREVMTQVERLSSRDTKIALREDRLEICADSSVFVRSRAEGLHGRSCVGGSAPHSAREQDATSRAHGIFMLVVFAPRRGLTLLRSTRPLLQVSRSTLFCVSTFGMFYALGFVPLATAAAIGFTAPLIVTALAPFALGERVGAARAIAVGVGFLGAMVVVRPGSGAYHWAVFLIFVSAAASAVTQVLSRKVAGHDAPETP